MIQVRVVRAENSDDVAAFIELNAQFNEVKLSTAQATRNLKTCADQVILAEVEGRPAGFACLLVVPLVCYTEPTAEVTELYVVPEFRRRGVGRTLMRHAELLAHQAGAQTIGLVTGLENTSAQAFYHELGYQDSELFLEKGNFSVEPMGCHSE